MSNSGEQLIRVYSGEAGMRLDTLVASRMDSLSRSRASELIQSGKIRVAGSTKKPGYRVAEGDEILIAAPTPKAPVFEPEPIDIDILYEDEHLVVVNKQAGLVVHPAPGHFSGTLVNALLYHCPDLKGVGDALRPGIVHRLDRDTSGVLLVAKNDIAHRHLSQQFKSRSVRKTYLGMVYGIPPADSGRICLPVGRDPVDRKKMSTKSIRGREAETIWRVMERFEGMTLLEVDLKTGRTHQIRVHFAAIGHPIIGDTVYGARAWKNVHGRPEFFKKPTDIFRVSRHLLHAHRLTFIHPISRRPLVMESPIPEDMQTLIEALRCRV